MPQNLSSGTEDLKVLTAPRPLAPWWRETRATLSLAAPLVMAQIAQIAIGTTDVLMMGWLGPASLAAGALGHNLLFPLFLFGLGIVSAVIPMTAQELGARSYRGVRRTLRQGPRITQTPQPRFALPPKVAGLPLGLSRSGRFGQPAVRRTR